MSGAGTSGTDSLESARYKAGMRRLAAGVTIITTADADGRPHGLVATAVTSVSAEPPTLLVCINRTASGHPIIRAHGRFCVNLLSVADHQVAQRFTSPDREARFAERTWTTLRSGAPALSDCLATFDCELAETVEAHTHTVFFGRVLETKLWPGKVAPLLYWDGAFASTERSQAAE